MKQYLQLKTAREIQTTLAKAFYDGLDETRIFTLHPRAFSLEQSGRPLSSYYDELIEILQELDYRDKVKMKDPYDVIAYKSSSERIRTQIFLNGLDEEFEQVRGEILHMEPSLGLERIYACIRREDNRRAQRAEELLDPDSMAMITKRVTTIGTKFNNVGNARASSTPIACSYEVDKNKSRHCTHCGANGHTQVKAGVMS